jgi:hypothetical protein
MKTYGELDVQIHIFLTSQLDGGGWPASSRGRFTPRGKSPPSALDRRLGGPRAGLDDIEKRKFLTLPGLELRPLGRHARGQSLYRLRYPCSIC